MNLDQSNTYIQIIWLNELVHLGELYPCVIMINKSKRIIYKKTRFIK